MVSGVSVVCGLSSLPKSFYSNTELKHKKVFCSETTLYGLLYFARQTTIPLIGETSVVCIQFYKLNDKQQDNSLVMLILLIFSISHKMELLCFISFPKPMCFFPNTFISVSLPDLHTHARTHAHKQAGRWALAKPPSIHSLTHSLTHFSIHAHIISESKDINDMSINISITYWDFRLSMIAINIMEG